jgi:hypothetical protein
MDDAVDINSVATRLALPPAAAAGIVAVGTTAAAAAATAAAISIALIGLVGVKQDLVPTQVPDKCVDGGQI